jgi:membrane protein DedA with SNARE-associated domain
MWWQYCLVFLGALLFDIVPFPFLPAFTIMIFLQLVFDLNIWATICIGVAGSILGRYILTLYIHRISDTYFKPAKNEDIMFLGKKLKEKGWKSQIAIFSYSLLPLPTTPLFVAGGMAKITPLYIIPAFFAGKFISDTAALLIGEFALTNLNSLESNILSWKSAVGLVVSLFLLCALLFINWRTLIQKKKFLLTFKIFKTKTVSD